MNRCHRGLLHSGVMGLIMRHFFSVVLDLDLLCWQRAENLQICSEKCHHIVTRTVPVHRIQPSTSTGVQYWKDHSQNSWVILVFRTFVLLVHENSCSCYSLCSIIQKKSNQKTNCRKRRRHFGDLVGHTLGLCIPLSRKEKNGMIQTLYAPRFFTSYTYLPDIALNSLVAGLLCNKKRNLYAYYLSRRSNRFC